MKIVKHGYFSKDGIYMECEYCSCNFLIENKYDFKTQIAEIFRWGEERSSKVVDYSIVCPECNSKIFFGNKDIPHHPAFSRKDWKERYEIKLEEVKNEI